MKAIRVHQFGPPEVMRLETVADPVPAAGQVVVRVKAAGVNPFDTYIRSGQYAIKPGFPYTPGADAAGVVERVGEGVSEVTIGDRVYVGRSLSGTYADLVLCMVSQVHPLAERLSFAQGAGVYIPYATAYRALVQRGGVRPSEWVLVHGASGGVGIAGVQLARGAGARVIGTAGTEKGLALVRGQGAHVALNHTDPAYLDEVRRLTGYPGGGVHMVLEMLANVNLEKDLGVLALGGRVVVIGSRGTVELTARQTMSRESSILGMSLNVAPEGALAEACAAIGAGLENGSLTPVVGREMPLAEAGMAHEAVMAPGAHGKIVLIP